jgi:NAD(P)-dependent dehydrogenase (short-subunit alcohol dehydrogenase family)
MSEANDMTDSVVAVTGGARGIGLATVDAFLAAGAGVVIGDLDATLARDVAANRSPRVLGMGLDVTDSASFGTFLDTATRDSVRWTS